MTEKENQIKETSERKKFRVIIRDLLLKFLTSSSSHGLPRIFTSDELLIKIMWALMFFSMTGYLLYSCSILLTSYLQYQTSASINTYQEIPAKFPAVTICNQKLVDKTNNPNFNTVLNKNSLNSVIYLLNQDYTPFEIISKLIYVASQIENFHDASNLSLSYEISDMLVSCQFNKAKCTVKDFLITLDRRRGLCYTFNQGNNSDGSDIKTVSSALGPQTGLVLELYVGNPDIDTYFEFNDGIILSIHNQSLKPFTENLELKAAAGAETDFIISRNFVTKLPDPYGNCLDNTNSNSSFNSEIFDYIVRNQSENYSQRYCFSLCQQKATMDICSCSNLDLANFENNGIIYVCDSSDQITCKDDIIANFSTIQYKSRLSDCIKSCPYACSSMEYIVVPQISLYPNKYYAENILSLYAEKKGLNLSSENIYKAFVKVNIYYESMQYTSMVESPSFTGQSLLANVGGYFGLCLGLSLLSLVEIIELIFKIIITLVINFKKKNSAIEPIQKADETKVETFKNENQELV
jgi:hypothetical protein